MLINTPLSYRPGVTNVMSCCALTFSLSLCTLISNNVIAVAENIIIINMTWIQGGKNIAGKSVLSHHKSLFVEGERGDYIIVTVTAINFQDGN